jgi:hypothetical protein
MHLINNLITLGLELDWTYITWDGDFRYGKNDWDSIIDKSRARDSSPGARR